jgi:hypothetical protein
VQKAKGKPVKGVDAKPGTERRWGADQIATLNPSLALTHFVI